MIEKKTVSQCISSDYCIGWNDAVDAMRRYVMDLKNIQEFRICNDVSVDNIPEDISENMVLVEPEKEQQCWVNVEDRLPEDNVSVLVYALGTNEESVVAMTSYTHRMYGFNIEGWRSPWQYFFDEYKITHWMLPPEPPKEEEHG